MVLVLALLVGCGDDGTGDAVAGGTYSCRAAFPGASTPSVCIEASGGTAQDLANNRQQCAAQGNMFATEGCPRAGLLGGCRETTSASDAVLTTWYYTSGSGPSSAADIQMLCQGLGSVAPASVMISFVSP